MKKYTVKLIELIKKNPSLDILPMVDSDICEYDYDYGYYMGDWGNTSVDEVYMLDDRVYLKSEDRHELIEKAWEEIFDNNGYKFLNDLTDEEQKRIDRQAETDVENLPWKKVIVVKINLPQ